MFKYFILPPLSRQDVPPKKNPLVRDSFPLTILASTHKEFEAGVGGLVSNFWTYKEPEIFPGSATLTARYPDNNTEKSES